jgi:putative peptide zinc metalloprotease protein
MAVAFIVAKTFHELGHAYSIKRWGGEVHEIGVLFLVLAPMPYVDASSSTSFQSRWRRAAVGAAGVYVELLVAAIALLLWVNLEPGLLRSAAFNLVFVASVSTLLFNANPLLRYDGYYVLGDVLDLPNLGPQSFKYLSYLAQRYLLGVTSAARPLVNRSEACFLAVYGIASFCYRIFVLVLIALFLAQRYFFIGVLLAIWAVFSSFLIPICKAVRFLMASPVLSQGRPRAIAGAATAVVVVLLLVFVAPMPLTTATEGIVWPPPAAEVAAGSGGFVSAVLVGDGEKACAGCPLVELTDSELPVRIQMLEARRTALLARYQAEYGESLVKAQMTQNEIRHVEEQLANEREQARRQKIVAPNSGEFVRASPEDLIGRFVQRGTVVGYVVQRDDLLVRAIVRQDDVGLVRMGVKRVRVRLASAVSQPFEAERVRAIPLASDRLPNMALSSIGGGAVALDPDAKKDVRALQKHFEFQFRLMSPPQAPRMGERAYIQIVHGVEPLALQWWRRIRQLFLRQFSV